MDYFNARISIETTRLLMEMTNIYEEDTQMTVTKGNVLMLAFEDAQWVPANQWKKIRDYDSVTTAEYDIKPSFQKLKIQISVQVEKGLNALKTDLTKRFDVRNVTMGVIISYVLKAAYIKHRDSDFKDEMTGKAKSELLDDIFAEYEKKFSAVVAEDKKADFDEIYGQLKKELGNKI